MRITSVLTVFSDGSKLPPLVTFKRHPTPKGKAPAANSIEREFNKYKDNNCYDYRCHLRRKPVVMALPAGVQ